MSKALFPLPIRGPPAEAAEQPGQEDGEGSGEGRTEDDEDLGNVEPPGEEGDLHGLLVLEGQDREEEGQEEHDHQDDLHRQSPG